MQEETSTNRTMASTLATGIRQDIIKGMLEPGARLRIKELCERYAAGAIPMREALSRLAMTGFVVAEDQRGFRVSVISPNELSDITDTRIYIETEALRRSVTNGGVDWEERLLATHHRLTRQQSQSLPSDSRGAVYPAWSSAHNAFHATLLDACGSTWMQNLAELLRDQTERYRNLAVQRDALLMKRRGRSARDIPAEHKAILDAALNRDAPLACALLAAHFRATSASALPKDD